MPRQQRLQVLLQRDASAARWLTVIGAHLEGALWIGLMVLFYLLLATTGRTRLELAVTDQRRHTGLALAGTPVQWFLRHWCWWLGNRSTWPQASACI